MALDLDTLHLGVLRMWSDRVFCGLLRFDGVESEKWLRALWGEVKVNVNSKKD